jgi:HK97 family phage major capsid protein
MSTGLSEELYRSLIDSLYAVPPEQRRLPGMRWVMNDEWWHEVRRMSDSSGRPLFEPALLVGGPDLLLGKPVEVRPDGGVPHLETA